MDSMMMLVGFLALMAGLMGGAAIFGSLGQMFLDWLEGQLLEWKMGAHLRRGRVKGWEITQFSTNEQLVTIYRVPSIFGYHWKRMQVTPLHKWDFDEFDV